MDEAPAPFAEWIGREQRSADRLDPALAARWLATFDRAAPASAAMPQGIHLCLCSPEASTASLGADGHPTRDDSAASFFPPIALERRMWASSTMEFHAPLAIGALIERTSRIASIAPKSGSRGDMVFVEVDHDTNADGALAVRERQTLVYLDAVDPASPLVPAVPGDGAFDGSEWDETRVLNPDERLLFRFSALTFNTHRIHYDVPYARDVERYRGLVVHGPLMASLLLQLAGTVLGENRLAQFAFRAVSPAICGEKLHLAMKSDDDGIAMGAFTADGRQVVKAQAAI